MGMFLKPEVLLLLLDWAGAKVDIFIACVLGDNDRVAAMLQADPALVHARTGEDHVLQTDLTPLHLAARQGHLSIATLLLDAGADVNAQASQSMGLTPLHLAIWKGRREVLRILPDMPRLLLERGADITIRDTVKGLTPLEWAELDDTEMDRKDIASLLREIGATA